jgi:hypothetical protein
VVRQATLPISSVALRCAVRTTGCHVEGATAGRSHALPRRRRQGYNASDSRDRIAQIAFDWSMMKAADQENFDRKRSREIRGLWSG